MIVVSQYLKEALLIAQNLESSEEYGGSMLSREMLLKNSNSLRYRRYTLYIVKDRCTPFILLSYSRVFTYIHIYFLNKILSLRCKVIS